MAKATIIEDLGGGQYTIQRNWAGRDEMTLRIAAYNAEADKLQSVYDGMPISTDEEIFQKRIVFLQIESLKTNALYLQNNMPEDAEVNAWCADYTEGLTGEVGTIDIAGEYTADVNIRPGDIDSNAYSGERDGELYPAIALGPWTSFLNQCIYPGWQKFAPLHRYGIILEGSIDYTENNCVVAIQPTFSLMNYNVNKPATGGGDEPAAASTKSTRIKNYNVNYGDVLGQDQIEVLYREVLTEDAAREFFIQNSATAHPGFKDFLERNPTHPISLVTKLNSPIWMTDKQYIALERICRFFDYSYFYESDRSGYKVSDYWDVMYDIGDPWLWTPAYKNEPQNEFTFGNVTLEYDNSGNVIRSSDETLEDLKNQYEFGWFKPVNLELWYEATRLNTIGPKQKRTGDCEDFVLTKMQAIIETGLIPAASLQVLLCYVVNAGYHAVLGIQTANRGFLISDQRDYGQLWEIEQLKDTHIWESFSIATAAGGDSEDALLWAKTQLILKDVPIEYMDCNSSAFAEGDEVIVEFTGQNWDNPKIIGFKESPKICNSVYVFPGQSQRYEDPNGSRTMRLDYLGGSWAWKAKFPRTYYFPPDIFGSGDRLGYAATGENGIGLTLGGNSIADAGPTEQYFKDLDLFDSTTESFSIGNDITIEKTNGCFESLKNGKCISHGGRTAITVHSETHQYAIANDSWSRLKNGQQIFDHASFVIDGKVYTVCGSIYQSAGLISYLIGHGTQQSTQTQVYNNLEDSWNARTTCPKNDWTNVNGYNLENKGLAGGGAQSYKAGDVWWNSTNETYLYDASTYSWTKKGNGYSSYGNQATSTALNEQVALQFSGAVTGAASQGLTQWFDYKLSTDTWRNRGDFELTVNDDPVWYSHRQGAAGAEL